LNDPHARLDTDKLGCDRLERPLEIQCFIDRFTERFSINTRREHGRIDPFLVRSVNNRIPNLQGNLFIGQTLLSQSILCRGSPLAFTDLPLFKGHPAAVVLLNIPILDRIKRGRVSHLLGASLRCRTDLALLVLDPTVVVAEDQPVLKRVQVGRRPGLPRRGPTAADPARATAWTTARARARARATTALGLLDGPCRLECRAFERLQARDRLPDRRSGLSIVNLELDRVDFRHGFPLHQRIEAGEVHF
jgi:hypothetical protein